MLHFFKKIKKNIWKYHCFTPVHQKSLGRDRLKLVILDYFMPFCLLKSFLPFYSPKNLKNQNFEEMKRNYLGYHHLTHVYQKLQPYDVQFQRYRLKWIEFFVILTHFLPFYDPNNPEKKRFWKKGKTNTWRYYPFTHVQHKWRSVMYGSWGLRHDRQNFLSFVVIFCAFTPLTSQTIKISKN